MSEGILSASGGALLGGIVQMPALYGETPVINGMSFLKADVYQTNMSKVSHELSDFTLPVFTRALLPWSQPNSRSGLIVKAKTGVAMAFAEDGRQMFKTINGGVSWEEKSIPRQVSASFENDAALNPTNKTWIALCSDSDEDYIIRTEDDGETWTSILINNQVNFNSSGNITHVTGHVWIITTGNEQIAYRSVDDGKSWSGVATTGVSSEVCASNHDGSVILLLDNGGVTKISTNQGASFEDAGSHLITGLRGISHIKDRIWFAYGSGRALKMSLDDGNTWLNASGNTPTELASANNAMFYDSDKKHLFLSNTAGWIAISKNFGKTWALATKNNFISIAFDGFNYFGAGMSNAFPDDLNVSGVGVSKNAIGFTRGNYEDKGGISDYMRIL